MITYLIMFTQGSMKVEYRLIASSKTPAVIVREFKHRRRNINVIGMYRLEACDDVELS